MKRCRECLAEVSPDAVHCPQCGRELGPPVTLPSSSSWWSGPGASWRIATIVAGVIGALLLLFFVGTFLDPARVVPPDEANVAPVTPSPAPSLELVAVTAEELGKAYDENELAARDRFEGRPIRVTGTVLRIGSNQGEPTLLLQSGHPIPAAFADPAPLKALKAGEQVTITCETLAQVESVLGLRNCVLDARREPAPPVDRRVGPQ